MSDNPSVMRPRFYVPDLDPRAPTAALPADEARHPQPPLEERHQAVDAERGGDVQPGHRQVHLDAARGLLLRLHREHRQFGDAESESPA